MNLISLEIYGTKRRLFSKFYAKIVRNLLMNLEEKIEWKNLFIFFPRENWSFALDGYIKITASKLSEPFEGHTIDTSKNLLERAIVNTFVKSFPQIKRIIIEHAGMPCKVIYDIEEE